MFSSMAGISEACRRTGSRSTRPRNALCTQQAGLKNFLVFNNYGYGLFCIYWNVDDTINWCNNPIVDDYKKLLHTDQALYSVGD